MGWAIGFVGGRDVGYGVPCTCEYPTCKAIIDRGLSFACGGFPGQDEFGCGGFFCGKHMFGYEDEYGEYHEACDVCTFNHNLPEDRWRDSKPTYPEKPDRNVWVRHKLNHGSWAQWRSKNKAKVLQMKQQLKASTKHKERV